VEKAPTVVSSGLIPNGGSHGAKSVPERERQRVDSGMEKRAKEWAASGRIRAEFVNRHHNDLPSDMRQEPGIHPWCRIRQPTSQ